MAMIFPFSDAGLYGHATGLVLGVLLGMAFGAVLERAGFGSAQNLAAQFYGGDNRVLKVMFTGIATTAALLGLLSSAGLVSIDALTVPETFLGPQIVGGLLLGAGFIVSGYCPGTGVVGAASGRLDAALTYGGVIVGSLLFGLAWPVVEGFYGSGAMGSVRLDQLLGLPFHVVAIGVVALATGAFFGAERLETFLAARRGGEAPDRAPAVRNTSLALVAAAALLSVLPVFGDAEAASIPAARVTPIAPLELAARMVQDPGGLWIVDLRDPAACAAARVPGATCRPADDPEARFVADLPPTRTLVLVDGELPASASGWPADVRVLTGGYAAFRAQVLTAPTLAAEPTLEQVQAFKRASALHGHFTGSAAPAAAPVSVPRKAAGGVVKKGGGC